MAQKNNTRKNPGLFQKIKRTKWYVLLPVIIIIGLLLNLVYKKAMTKYDISLLDKAETKLRALDLPKADKTTYKHSCSVRSVKFQDPGDPTCRVQRIDIYSESDKTKITNIIKDSQIATNAISATDNSNVILSKLESKLSFYKDMDNYSKGLNCYQSYGTVEDFELERLGATNIPNSASYLLINNTCSKKFPTLAYPED